jgi:hypothetical protein
MNGLADRHLRPQQIVEGNELLRKRHVGVGGVA